MQATLKGVAGAAAPTPPSVGKYGVGLSAVSNGAVSLGKRSLASAAKAGATKFTSEVGMLYKGCFGAATGAGIAIGAYFAFYGTAKKLLQEKSDMPVSQIAFVAGGIGALGSSIVKVPAAVCIRSVQAGVYPNVIAAGRRITAAAGPRGLFTGYIPTLLEDVPDMAVKFAAYETLRTMHRSFTKKSKDESSTGADIVMGLIAGSVAAAATTPLDVVKTRMMCNASSRPSFGGAIMGVWKDSPPGARSRPNVLHRRSPASDLQRYQLRHLLLLLRSSPLRFGQGRNRTRTTASAGDQRVECGYEEFSPRLQRRFC